MAISAEQKIDIVTESAKSAPPVAITAASGLLGLTLHDWVAIATIAYIVLQTGWLLWKWRRAVGDKKWKPQ